MDKWCEILIQGELLVDKAGRIWEIRSLSNFTDCAIVTIRSGSKEICYNLASPRDLDWFEKRFGPLTDLPNYVEMQEKINLRRVLRNKLDTMDRDELKEVWKWVNERF